MSIVKIVTSRRFGSTVSPHVKQAEISDAIKKRQERFGVVTKPEKVNISSFIKVNIINYFYY